MQPLLSLQFHLSISTQERVEQACVPAQHQGEAWYGGKENPDSRLRDENNWIELDDFFKSENDQKVKDFLKMSLRHRKGKYCRAWLRANLEKINLVCIVPLPSMLIQCIKSEKIPNKIWKTKNQKKTFSMFVHVLIYLFQLINLIKEFNSITEK